MLLSRGGNMAKKKQSYEAQEKKIRLLLQKTLPKKL